MSLEDLSDQELSYLAVDLAPRYKLIAEGVRTDVMSVIAGLYETDKEVYNYCRGLLIDWMYMIADHIEINEQNQRTIGFKFGNADEPEA